MRYRQLTPDIRVSEVGFGNWTVTTGWWGSYTESEAIDLHCAAFDAGITFFDTADAYAEGYGEQVLGKALAEVRDQVIIATKFGYDISDASTANRRGQQERAKDFSRDAIATALDASLARLGVDHIDVWQLHNPRMGHLNDDGLFEFLEQAQAAGKIRTYGVALGPKIGWLNEGVHAMRTRAVPAMQMIYNLLEPDPGRALLATAHQTGTRMIVRVPHSSGMLEGNLTADTVFDRNDHRRHRPRSWLLEGVQKVATLDFLTKTGAGVDAEPGSASPRTLGQAALRWVLADDHVATTLPNIYGREQLAEFAAASDVADLTAEELARIEQLRARNFGVTPLGDQVTKVDT